MTRGSGDLGGTPIAAPRWRECHDAWDVSLPCVGRVREERWGGAPLEAFGPFIVRPGSDAGDRGGAGEHDAEADQEERNGAVEDAFEAMEGHDLNSYLWISPTGWKGLSDLDIV